MISRALDTAPNQSANEALGIYLRDADETSRAYFGVGSSE
jgi:hypothetical protein